MQKVRMIFGLFLIMMSGLARAELPELTKGILGKNPGDVIAVQSDAEVAAWCDFTKTIAVTATNTLCVYAGNKRTHTSGYGYSLLKSVKSIFAA